MANVDVETMSDSIVSDVPNRDISIDFKQALNVLKEEERVAMLLFYVEDKTINKISKIMNSPTGTIKSHLYRGKEKLKKYLKN